MTSQGAEKAITTSALIIAGVYIYRRFTEGSSSTKGSKTAQLLGQGSPPSIGVFVTAWGAAFLLMSITAQASPGLGGSFAILAATADVLSNGQQIFNDINTKIGTAPPTSGKLATNAQMGLINASNITHGTMVGPLGTGTP